MATTLPPTTINPAVGSRGAIDFGRFYRPSASAAPQAPAGRAGAGLSGAVVAFYNNSDADVQLTFPTSGSSIVVPRGWVDHTPLPVNETSVQWLVLARSNYVQYISEQITLVIFEYYEVAAGAVPPSQPLGYPTVQPRVVTMPFATLPDSTGAAFWPAVGAAVNIGTLFMVNTLIGQTIHYYLYRWRINNRAAAAAGSVAYELRLDVQDAANVSVGFPFPALLLHGVVSYSAGGLVTPDELPPGPSIVYPFAPPVGSDHAVLNLLNGVVDGGAPNAFRFVAAQGIHVASAYPGPVGFPQSLDVPF